MSRACWVALAALAAGLACDGREAALSSGPIDASAQADGGGVAPRSCSLAAIKDIEVSSEGLRGYPPYSISGCRLVYVTKDGALRLRELDGDGETEIAPAAEVPRGPSITSELIAWQATIDGRTRVRVLQGGALAESPADFVAANEARAHGGAVVFTGWRAPPPLGDSDVWILEGGASRLALGGSGQQRFADVDDRWVAVSDFSEDPDGTFDQNETDLADVVLVDRRSGEIVRRPSPGKQAFPMLAQQDVIAYLDWKAVHPEPKFEAFQIRAGGLRALPTDDRTISEVKYGGAPALPITRGGTVEWVADANDGIALFRAPADGSSPPAMVEGARDLAIATPSATQAVTIVASEPAMGAGPKLRAIPR
jgi:hypothetical protein